MKPENRLIKKINDLLPADVYREKMANPWRGGTPDMWYSSKAGDLWIEWKWLPRKPKEFVVPDLSALQRDWLDCRQAEGRNVAVFVGAPDGVMSFWYSDDWTNGRVWTPSSLAVAAGKIISRVR